MQKFFVGYQYNEAENGVNCYGYTFARKRGEARKRAEGKIGKGKQIVALWVCELADLNAKPALVAGAASQNNETIIKSMLTSVRDTYKRSIKKKKDKPHIKLLPAPAKTPKEERSVYFPYTVHCASIVKEK